MCGIDITMYTMLVLALLAVAGTLFWYVPFRRDIRAAYERLEGLESHLARTPCGAIEYGTSGHGQALLLVHGNGGGFDQGLDLGADIIGSQYMGIAPSRFGYLGSPLPEGADQAMQADTFACLLDELGIERVPVIAWSAGGMSAAQLALRHPERVSALVLVSTKITASDAEEHVRLPPAPGLRAVFGSDFLIWLMTKPFRTLTQRMFVPRTYQLTAEEDAVVAEALRKSLPLKPRTTGAVFDTLEVITEPDRRPECYRPEVIRVPTLVVSAKDDPSVSYDEVVEMTRRIPDARLVTVEAGGHLMLGNGDLVRREVRAFLSERVEEALDMPRHGSGLLTHARRTASRGPIGDARAGLEEASHGTRRDTIMKTSMLGHDLHRVGSDEFGQAAGVLSRAFQHDAAVEYIHPREQGRVTWLEAMFLVQVRIAHAQGLVHATEDFRGVAVWFAPGNHGVAPWKLIGVGLALGFKSPFGVLRRGVRFLQHSQLLHRRSVTGDHWYLQYLGVDSTHRGQGVGSSLLRPMLARADAEGLPVYLETANARTIALYRRHGFDVVAEGTVPFGGPRLWAMVRGPGRRSG
jgi:2-hydroxy-6-oxonona-2,4-dienedioate hydrolase